MADYFNKKNEFNLPVGKRDFNSNLRKKLKNFIYNLQLVETKFQNIDFRDINLEKIDSENTFFILIRHIYWVRRVIMKVIPGLKMMKRIY